MNRATSQHQSRGARTGCWIVFSALVALGVDTSNAADVQAANNATPRAAIEDRVLQRSAVTPDALYVPLANDRAIRSGSTDRGLLDTAVVSPDIDALRNQQAASSQQGTLKTPLPSTPKEAALHIAASALATPTADRMGGLTYQSFPGDRLDTSPRFSERGIARKFDGEFSIAAGTGGSLQTSASVTLPLIDNVLSVRVSGSKGRGYPLGGDYRSVGNRSVGSYRDGPLQFNDFNSSGDSNVGFDLHWAPTDSFNLNLQTSKTQQEFRAKGRH